MAQIGGVGGVGEAGLLPREAPANGCRNLNTSDSLIPPFSGAFPLNHFPSAPAKARSFITRTIRGFPSVTGTLPQTLSYGRVKNRHTLGHGSCHQGVCRRHARTGARTDGDPGPSHAHRRMTGTSSSKGMKGEASAAEGPAQETLLCGPCSLSRGTPENKPRHERHPRSTASTHG